MQIDGDFSFLFGAIIRLDCFGPQAVRNIKLFYGHLVRTSLEGEWQLVSRNVCQVCHSKRLHLPDSSSQASPKRKLFFVVARIGMPCQGSTCQKRLYKLRLSASFFFLPELALRFEGTWCAVCASCI